MHFLNYTKKGYTLVPIIEPICNEICGTTGMAYPCSKNTIFFKIKYFICQSLYNLKLIKWYLKGHNNNFIDFKKNINIEIK